MGFKICGPYLVLLSDDYKKNETGKTCVKCNKKFITKYDRKNVFKGISQNIYA